jgi:hypothetical protein
MKGGGERFPSEIFVNGEAFLFMSAFGSLIDVKMT